MPARQSTFIAARLVALGFALAALPAPAHDLWLHTDRVPESTAEEHVISLRIGGHGQVEPIAFDPRRIDRLLLRLPGATQALELGQAQDQLVLPTPGKGVFAVGYVGVPTLSVLSSAGFDQYLREEGLDAVIATRAKDAAAAGKITEHFSRSLKTVINTGGAPLVDCALDLPLELSVLDSDQRGLVVQATFEGRPLPGLWVDRADGRGTVVEAHRTDASGRAAFTSGPGDWILRGTHMRPAASSDVAWRSWWASTSFRWDGSRVERCEPASASKAAPLGR